MLVMQPNTIAINTGLVITRRVDLIADPCGVTNKSVEMIKNAKVTVESHATMLAIGRDALSP